MQPIFCKNCLSMSTRPRIIFDKNGLCNACVWSIKKKKINWKKRQSELRKLLREEQNKKNNFDCIVPVSGGKDGSYVAYNLKKKYNVNPLCVTVRPALPTQLGNDNIYQFVKSGFPMITVDVGYESLRKINKLGFINLGFPYYGWLVAIFTAVLRVAESFNIDLIFYAEDGEVEYGGTPETEKKAIFDINYIKKIYVEGGYDKLLRKANLTEKQTYFLRFPFQSKTNKNKIKLTHWSYFENWDPYRNYLIAKEYCGLIESLEGNQGTFTNFSQNDQFLYDLHTFIMYLKFGFGRANQDACIEIRRGAISRDQAINLVKLYDGKLPKEHILKYLDYYQIKEDKFYSVLRKWTNHKLFNITGKNEWVRKFDII